MLFDKTYKIINQNCDFEFVERNSRFIALARKVTTELEAKQTIKDIKDKYPDASHHCYAYCIGIDRSIVKFSDDGEPTGTAGKPILKYINEYQLTHILIVVIRYFGGKLLGVPGLIAAYGNSSKQVISKCSIISKTIEDWYQIKIDIEYQHLIYPILKKLKIGFQSETIGNKLVILAQIHADNTSQFLNEIKKITNFELKYIKTE